MEKNNDYLPIGSICKLKNGTEFVVVTGYSIKTSKGYFDYSAASYPIGITSYKRILTFNKSDIESVIFTGYKSEKYNKFIEQLIKIRKQFELDS